MGQKPSQELLLSHQATSQQDRGRDGKSPSCSHPHTIQQLSIHLARLCFGTAGAHWPWGGFEPGWLKFNISPAVSAVPWEATGAAPPSPWASLS